ncbi:CBS domain-containing protein [Streptomyces sp. KL116D]|uniref:CBS domain-containing protein n=1 Tax=Streptomyces sp. KL116D TaxID=3045152 RepID=UPI003556A1D9
MTEGVTAVRPDTPLTQTAQSDAGRGHRQCADRRRRRLLGLLAPIRHRLRVVAEGADPRVIEAGDVCTPDPLYVAPEEETTRVVSLMRRHAVRRLPVVSEGLPVGVVSLGDLAEHRDPESALADISRAEPSPGQGTVPS